MQSGLPADAASLRETGSIDRYTLRGPLSHRNVYFSDVPRQIIAVITYEEGEMYFTAVLELGDMFYGGGVPIHHYIIQVEDGIVLETPGPTYSFDIMYNTSLSVNISAHNCAGYSDPFPLELQHNEGRVNDYLTMMSQIPIQ